MEYITREYPLLSVCGLNCGLCPRYHTDGKSQCPGCAGEKFLEKHPSCGLLSCYQRHGIEYCYLCEEYPCNKYDGADTADSFITHLHQLTDFEKIKNLGLTAYQSELNGKIGILRDLLANYNDGRQKNFYCIAINLLELADVKRVMEQISEEVKEDEPIKAKVAAAVRLFQAMADERNVVLKLRKKQI